MPKIKEQMVAIAPINNVIAHGFHDAAGSKYLNRTFKNINWTKYAGNDALAKILVNVFERLK